MAINIQTLTTELSSYGQVSNCEENNPKTFIVVVENTTTDIQTIQNITDNHISSDYPLLKDITLVNNIFKCLYSKE